MLQRSDWLSEHTGPEQRTWRRADKTNGAGEEAYREKKKKSNFLGQLQFVFMHSFFLFLYIYIYDLFHSEDEESDLVVVDQVQYSLIED